MTKKKQTHRYREQTNGYQWGEGRGRGNKGRGSQTITYKISHNDTLMIHDTINAV